jgi:hypothetical protein
MRVREQLSPGAVHADAASLHNVPAIGKLQRKIRVLLYKKHCHAGVAKGAHRAHHFGHHQRREAERGLVEQEQLRPGHQGAAEGEHLLLPTRERAGRLPAALPQDVRPEIVRPSNRMVPFRGRSRPQIVRSVVLFPAPLAPIMATISPRLTSSDTPRSVSASS